MSDAIRPKPQDLTAYLLGAAPAGDAERMDELSITDDEFAEALDAAEMDLIDSYVNGELAPADRESFERKYVRSATQADRVVFADALQEYAASRLSARPAVNTGGSSSIFEWSRRYFQFGLAAAALLLAIVGGWLFIGYSEPTDNVGETAAVQNEAINSAETRGNSETGQTEPARKEEVARIEAEPEKPVGEKPKLNTKQPDAPSPQVVAIVLGPQLRSTGALREVAVPEGTDHVSARLELESNDFRSYRVALREHSTNRTVWQSNRLKAAGPADARRLTALIPTRLLSSGIYTFTVSGISVNGSAEIIGDYPLRVVR